MARHFVIMSSSYSLGKRIAIDYSSENKLDFDVINKQIDEIIKQCGKDVSMSTHFVQTETTEWKSLIKADSFFEDVLVVNPTEFIELINQDRELKGTDVAKYILSLVDCTHLKLEKLVYLCYAEYLVNTGKQLFQDKIFAFQYGPVVETVYHRYKSQGKEKLEENIKTDHIDEMPARSRVLFAKEGTEKLKYIDKIIQKYGNLPASELVNLTHQEKTPWKMSYKEEKFTEINDNCILEYHKNEK